MKLGKIRVSHILIEDSSWSEIWASLSLNFKEIERKFDPFSGCWILVGESHLFDELKEGEDPPFYGAHLSNTPKNPFRFAKFTRE
jgi:hypothetical protein